MQPPSDYANRIDADRVRRHCGDGLNQARAEQYAGDVQSVGAGIMTPPRPTNTAGHLTFEQALTALKAGARASRIGWNGVGQYVQIQRPDDRSKMTEPYIYLRNSRGGLVPWLASQGDLLASDWTLSA